MGKLVAVLVAFAWMAWPAAASDRTDALAIARKFVDAIDKGDAKTMLGDCAAQSAVIDDFPPYHWQGAAGCADWASDFDAFAKKNGITDAHVTLGKPRHVEVTGDRAYLVVPGAFSFRQAGKLVTQGGATWTIALQKFAEGWRITAWSWADH
jgi:hypothetical protein